MVDKDSEEAKIIKQYVKNTHASTHNAYDLKVMEVSSWLEIRCFNWGIGLYLT